MSKLSKGAQDRLTSLLYRAGSVEVAGRIPAVSKFLYDGVQPVAVDTKSRLPKSILNELSSHEWNQKPMEQAVKDLPDSDKTNIKSNILAFKCKTEFLSPNTFKNLYPINRERIYALTDKSPIMSVIKARDKNWLSFFGAYYLIFPSHMHAATYWLETKGKLANGFNMNLEFVAPNIENLAKLSSPFFYNNTNDASHSNIVFETALNQLAEASSTSNEVEFNEINKFCHVGKRESMVLVRNLPFGIQTSSIKNFLWDYEVQSTATISSDPIKQQHINIIKFSNHTNASRFVRNFHGKHWDSYKKGVTKSLYHPLICEILY